MKILITGANGFLGSHLVEKALADGHETIAGVRPGASLKNLEHLSGFERLDLDYTSEDSIAEGLKRHKIDLFIHNAGLTKSYSLDRYLQVNVDITERIVHVLKNTKTLTSGGKFAYISSLAARGPVGNNGPASNYGISKLRAEIFIKESGINYLIFRPAGIYGSRDVQFVPLVKMVKMGIYPIMTSEAHRMALINARDVAKNVIHCSQNHSQAIVHLDDGNVYLHDDMKAAIENLVNKKSRKLFIPVPLVRKLLYASDIIDKNLNRVPKLSLEHYNEISQDWDYDYTEERKRIPLEIDYNITEGFKEAISY